MDKVQEPSNSEYVFLNGALMDNGLTELFVVRQNDILCFLSRKKDVSMQNVNRGIDTLQ
jgi:hypothetical protein